MLQLREANYHLLYVDGWDREAGEAAGGGRCVGSYADQGDAMDAHAALDGAAAMLLWGEGHLVITDAGGGLVFGPTLPDYEARRCPWCQGALLSLAWTGKRESSSC